MPISILILISILTSALISLIYFRFQVIMNIQNEESGLVLLIEIIPPLTQFSKKYRYSGYDLIDIIQHNLALQSSPAHRILAFFIRSNRKFNYLLNYTPVFNLTANHTIIEKIEWKTRIGTDDAMYTAVITGLIWTVKGAVIGKISKKSQLQSLNINVQPDFNKAAITSKLICILKMRIVHIIIIATYAFVLKVRRYIIGYGTRKTTAKSSH